MERQQSMFPWMRMFPNQPEFQFDPTPFMYMGAVCGIIGVAIPLYFLITRKVAYEKAAADLKSGVSQA
jgi:cell division protein FtsX